MTTLMELLVDESNRVFNEQQAWSREQHEKDPLPTEYDHLRFAITASSGALLEFVKLCWPGVLLPHVFLNCGSSPELYFAKVCRLSLPVSNGSLPGPTILRVVYTGLVEDGAPGCANQPQPIYLDAPTAERIWQAAQESAK